jgi:tetratricopeptide (TPR) repeat protein
MAEKEIEVLKSLRTQLLDSEENNYANQVQIQIKTSEAWLNYSKGNEVESLQIMREAADMEDKTDKHGVTPGEVLPARELYGDMLFAMNRFEEALEAYEIGLKSRPNRFNSIYGAAVSANKIGDHEKATRYFEMLIVLAEGANSNRPEIAEANTFLQENVI